MTLNDKILSFINKATSKARSIATELLTEFDREGYQSVESEKKLIMLYELRKFSSLLLTSDRGGMTDRQVNDTIDFFWKWAVLNKISVVQYTNYQSLISENIIVPSGTYASQADLNSEILSRIAGDQSLSNRITFLEDNQLDPSTFFPAGFFDNLNATYSVVFDDDTRLHTHANKAQLDAITASFITQLGLLAAHYASIGEPSGVHVSAGDRTNWNGKVSQLQLSGLSSVYAAISHTHTINQISGLSLVLSAINDDIANMAAADGRDVELQRNGDNLEWRLVGDPIWISLGSIKGDTGVAGDAFSVDARGTSNDRFSSGYNAEDENFTYLEEDTGYLYYRNPTGGPATIPAGWNNGIKFLGDNGWAPLLAVVEITSSRSVLEIVDWVGGSGNKPVLDAGLNPPSPTRWYLGPGGITLFPNLASNIKGPTGNGTPPVIGAVGNLAGRAAFDDSDLGFIYLRNDVSPQTIFIKQTNATADWSVEYPWQGPPGPLSSPGIQFGGLWNFASNGGNFPSVNSGFLFIAEDDHGAVRDADFVPEGTWFVSIVDSANTYSEFKYKL